jgi:hypothetical protein
MRLCIFGSRSFGDYVLLEMEASKINFDTLICGEAKGADSLGKAYAISRNIPVESYPADWGRYGKRAGYIRNVAMAHRCNMGLTFWDGTSRGTKMMIKILGDMQKTCVVIDANQKINQLELFQ